MKGPAIILRSYLQCRKQRLAHTEWLVLLAVAAMHGLWINRHTLARMLPGVQRKCLASHTVGDILWKLSDMDLIKVRVVKARCGGGKSEAVSITGAGMALVGWPELEDMHP